MTDKTHQPEHASDEPEVDVVGTPQHAETNVVSDGTMGEGDDVEPERTVTPDMIDVDADAVPGADAEPVDPLAAAEQQLAERTEDLQRLQAEYVNYKRRVDRDRDMARTGGIATVMGELLPILDGIEAGRNHEELTGGFKLVADEIDKLAAKFGLVAYGAEGDEFDPQLHDALMQVDEENTSGVPVCAKILQTGYKLGDRILRHARVAVADPTN